jgi:uncharacterized ferritin-like protein (DUF455 family)
VKVAAEEAKHYSSWRDRLHALGGKYGDTPTHDGLWESATDTSASLLARLAIVHMVHEARGLDTYLGTLDRFQRSGDQASLDIIAVNHAEEITHVSAGRKWFQFLCTQQGLPAVETYHTLVPMYFLGGLRPPFNTVSREKAGMGEEWYAPLVRSPTHATTGVVSASGAVGEVEGEGDAE